VEGKKKMVLAVHQGKKWMGVCHRKGGVKSGVARTKINKRETSGNPKEKCFWHGVQKIARGEVSQKL